MRILHSLKALRLTGLVLFCFFIDLTPVFAGGNPAFWQHEVKGDFDTVVTTLKDSLEANQFIIMGEENLSKGLENNKQVLGEDKWNTIGFDKVTSISFCSLVFNQEVFNETMAWSILCPFKAVVYTMKKTPDKITIQTIRNSYLLKKDKHKKAKEIGKKIDKRIMKAIKDGTS